MLANNLANAGTSGFKSDREFYSLYVSREALGPMPGSVTTLPVIEKQWTDFSQGALQTTGNPLDVALEGRGFLAVQGPHGVLYTRNGALHASETGELVTSEDFPVRAKGGDDLRISSERPVEIARDGIVRQDGHILGRLELVDFKSTDSLRKASGACFENTDPKNVPQPADDIQVEQGKLESSNVVVSESAMRLVGVMRQFEMLQKAVTMGVEMNQKAIQEVAKVGS